MKRTLWLLVVLAALALALTACGATEQPAPTQLPCPTAVSCPDCPDTPDCPECPEAPECPAPLVENVPFEAMWADSGHADATAEAFRHWDEEDPQVVPTNCAKCHSGAGYLDFLGVDGTAAGTVDNAAPVDTVISCEVCHNAGTAMMTSVEFPSGAVLTGLGPEARCMQCHQGRSSGPTVDAALADLTDEDVVSSDLRFQNVHYYAAAATIYGKFAHGGYEYEGQMYDGRLDHAEGYNTCIDCHDSHTLAVKVDECTMCHGGVTAETLKDIRMISSAVDYDGDGDITEGIAAEIEGLQALLLQNIQAYADEVSGAPITYDANAYPYFLGEDGGYAAWTPRLMKAAYNYQLSLKDPGAYAHGGKYIIQLLHDSIASLNEMVANPVDLSMLHRIDAGHFAGSEEAWRHWDEEGEVPYNCVKCHSGAGLPMYLENSGNTIAVEPSNGMLCVTCHDEANWPARYEAANVTFPSGKRVTFGEGLEDANLCLNCHQGRESTVSVNNAVQGKEDDAVDAGLRFRNIHYFAAGATLFGGDVQGAYEYDGQTYVGQFAHTNGFNTCIGCHDSHGLTINATACGICHTGVETVEDLADIRIDTTDYDGDGDTAEGIAGEVATYQEMLYAALQDYAANVAGAPITYNPARYPYWFGEDGSSFANWTPRLLKAAYNYQYAQKDPGAFAHNAKYIIQVMYDSMVDLGVDVTGMSRP